MGSITGISWCDSTFNPVIGCTKVSPACDHCYAEALQKRTGGPAWGPGAPRRRTRPANWAMPLSWNRRPFAECRACGWRGERSRAPGAETLCPHCHLEGTLQTARRRVFCASLADVFDNEWEPYWREDLFALIARTPNLDWLLLTKRIGNAKRMINEALENWGSAQARLMVDGAIKEPAPLAPWPWPNVWLGATVVTQDEVDRDVPKLKNTPAAVRFVSVEPMLGPIKFGPYTLTKRPCAICEMADRLKRSRADYSHSIDCGATQDAHRRGELLYPGDHPSPLRSSIDWVIVGGESGPGARPMSPRWVRALRDQCADAGTAFLFKQWGDWLPVDVHEPRGGQIILQPDDGRDAPEAIPGRVRITREHDQDFAHVGKFAAGDRLDGREHKAWPRSAA